MNVETKLVFDPTRALSDISSDVLFSGSKVLQNSRSFKNYSVSLREAFGLSVLTSIRSFIEKEGIWVFSTDSKISDDGSVMKIDGNKIVYCENIEQVYLPGNFLKRQEKQTMVDFILEEVSRKQEKGSEYFKDKSLFILSDIKSLDINDLFSWQDFVKPFFSKSTFLHVYFLSLISHRSFSNEYYFLSFTDQKHRQPLNGEFTFKLNKDGIYDIKCSQKINLLSENHSFK